jgi:competence ComEA-like helix-hairpin-helix protein
MFLAGAMLSLAAVVWVWGRPSAPPVEVGKPRPFFRVEINRADAQTLQLLPGVGPTIAERIVRERNKSPFSSLDDLTRVNGIGAKTAARLAPYVVFDPPPASPGTPP